MPQVQIPLIARPWAYDAWDLNAVGYTISNSYCVNGYYQDSEDALSKSRKLFLCKRPPLKDLVSAGATNFTNETSHKIRGALASFDRTKVYWISSDGATPYRNVYDIPTNTRTSASIAAASWSATTDSVWTLLDGIQYSTYAAVVTDFTRAALVDNAGTTYTSISDGDFTGLGVKTNILAMDGYLFVGVKSGTGAGKIYNSSLNTPGTWTAAAFFTPAQVPGQILWLCKLRGYMVIFKQNSIEFADNVGNKTPGSPCSMVTELTKTVGCYSVSSIQEVSDGIIFLGVDKRGKIRVYKLKEENLELEILSDQYIEACVNTPISGLDAYPVYSADPVTGSSKYGQSQVIIWQNKELYTLTIPNSTDTASVTFVYDTKLKVWVRWESFWIAFASDFIGDEYFKASQALNVKLTDGFACIFANNSQTTARWSFFNIQVTSSITELYYDQKDSSIAGCPYLFSWFSDEIDFGTNNRKFINSMEILYDALPDGAASTTANLLTFNILYREIDSTATTRTRSGQIGRGRRVKLHRVGPSRSRQWGFYTQDASPMRVSAIEIDYDQGEVSASTR